MTPSRLPSTSRSSRLVTFIVFVCLLSLMSLGSHAIPPVGTISPANAIVGANTNDKIGSQDVIVLPSGNVVIASPSWNGGRGAVTCLFPEEYKAGGGISITAANSLTGSTAGDSVGGSITVLTNGNYVVISSLWDGGFTNVGAITWVNGTTCLPHGESNRGVAVSAANSLVGSTANDIIGSALPFTGDGYNTVTALTNGNYVISSGVWDNGALANAGAVTWANGSTGLSGTINASNSLVGTTANDNVGMRSISSYEKGVTALSNGHYVVATPYWDDGAITDAGAATWGNGSTGITGVISAGNSLIGATASDSVGSRGITALTNGNYVVGSSDWDNGGIPNVGAVTWGNGASGTVGIVSASNSLVGSTAQDQIGSSFSDRSCVTPLTNGHYVVCSPLWDDGGIVDVGAATWGNGVMGITGVVSASNSLIGSSFDDRVGFPGVTPLPNGNYVVGSGYWDDSGTTNVGAATWGNGETGIVGSINASNSLIGSHTRDLIGLDPVIVFPNGNYLIRARFWNVGRGAVAWGDGTTGVSGVVSASNALVGSTTTDLVGQYDGEESGIKILANGNYIVASGYWDNGAIINTGAVTWGDGTTGIRGEVNASNSLIGPLAETFLGYEFLDEGDTFVSLANGNYVVVGWAWNEGRGLVVWGNGATGTVGVLNPDHALVGVTPNDWTGRRGVTPLTNGHYIVSSLQKNPDTGVYSYAATWGNGNAELRGVITPGNSLITSTSFKVIPLPNGNYVLLDRFGTGKALVGNGLTGAAGYPNPDEGLSGTTVDDFNRVEIVEVDDDSFLLVLPYWNNGATTDVGAIVYVDASFPPPTITVTPTAVDVTEGGATGEYSVSLAVEPFADVTITLTADAQSTVNPTTLTFTPSNWDTPQTVTVTAVDDNVVEGTHTSTITHSATGGGYDDTTITDVTVTITDDDATGVTITESDGTTEIIEGGATDTYTLALTSQPTADVTLTVTGDAQASVSPTTLTFTAADWDTPQTVTVTASQDDIAEGIHIGTLTHSAAGGGYDDTTIADVAASITDDDVENVTITESDGITEIIEGGATDMYTVVLTSQPISDVTLTVTGDSQASVSPTTLIFTDADWNVPQLITVTAIDDTDVEGTHTATITHSASTERYHGLTIANVTVSIIDDDRSNLLLNPSFEEVGSKPRKALNWIPRNLTSKDRRLCVSSTPSVIAVDGECVFRFKFIGLLNASRSIRQVITTPVWGDTGDTLTLSAQVSGKAFKPAAKMVLQVRYTDGTKEKVTAITPTKTFGYTAITSTLNVTRRVETVTVLFNVGTSNGTLWLDDATLYLNVLTRIPTSELRSLPDAPDGFRNGN